MLFSRVVSFLAFFLTLGAFTLALPVENCDNTTDIEAAFTALKASTDSILPQIEGIVSSGSATDASSVTPLLNQIVDVLNTANVALGTLDTSSVSASASGSIASLVVDIVVDITNVLNVTLNGLGLDSSSTSSTSSTDTALSTLIKEIDAALSDLLNSSILSNVLNLVSSILSSTGLLQGLSLTSLTGTYALLS